MLTGPAHQLSRHFVPLLFFSFFFLLSSFFFLLSSFFFLPSYAFHLFFSYDGVEVGVRENSEDLWNFERISPVKKSKRRRRGRNWNGKIIVAAVVCLFVDFNFRVEGGKRWSNRKRKRGFLSGFSPLTQILMRFRRSFETGSWDSLSSSVWSLLGGHATQLVRSNYVNSIWMWATAGRIQHFLNGSNGNESIGNSYTSQLKEMIAAGVPVWNGFQVLSGNIGAGEVVKWLHFREKPIPGRSLAIGRKIH